ncbi:MAG: glucose-phosphate adenylyltransferase [Sphaerochaeta sp.]|jgi:glucose-1-phosphate adenylyltransferase|uniref:Glucose-1-phosphate adenylyltransferase n=1 Tax=Sphaerochaeta halotolerans TaxID=2293840 RepID=A0A372MI22_9SPIR|nr:glucose-1-phosphate adenylyltransferase [Sphaerochaeta halotolerans]MBG0766986.1 glucose-1-phosphate adenylyltransferase [Spirochaetaceae bacterium]MDK2859882.1 glucose-phosphate adenylyltransferase [Sphaerochaeta sp.]MDN5333283.1 glucose-phosphate adenylyltransferase [Sphaerochaeta sp.]RFU95384.1 glucose-1-phosphate adenylyltransferase [Sphaerochaeta halotolerans]
MRTREKTIAIVLGGGKGTRLYPLTMDRAKPAVPFAGKYRLVDIPISNCINSEIRQIYILTQFNSASLHNHISNTYIFDTFSNGFVEVLAAEQTHQTDTWYQGTADAVRKNMKHFHDQNADYYIILSGDQLYRMDLGLMLERHIKSGAELTIAAKPISREQATGLGIISCDKEGMITNFYEKPAIDLDICEYKVDDEFMFSSLGVHADSSNEYLASMGIYIFNTKTMEEVLNNDKTDFGKEIIPDVIKQRKVATYLFDGFWEDIGTIKAFYETNLDLASINPQFNFYDERMPIYTHRRHLPATKVNFCNISNSLTSEGSIITNAYIVNSIIGVRTIIESGASLDGVYCMGASFYETQEQKAENAKKGIPNIGIGRGTIIRKAIIDQNARIGDGCRIGIDDIPRQEGDFAMYSIHDGIIIINKNAIIKNGTVM